MVSHAHTAPRLSGLTRLLTLSSLLWLGMLLTVSQAQMTLDGSLGPRGPLMGPNYRIGADVGQIRGGNLFHSFGEFNVPRGGAARPSLARTPSPISWARSPRGSRLPSMGSCGRRSPGRIVPAESQRGPVGAQCQLRCEWVLSRQHGGLSALCGRGEVLRHSGTGERVDGGGAGGLWILGQNPAAIAIQGARSRSRRRKPCQWWAGT